MDELFVPLPVVLLLEPELLFVLSPEPGADPSSPTLLSESESLSVFSPVLPPSPPSVALDFLTIAYVEKDSALIYAFPFSTVTSTSSLFPKSS